MCDCCGLAHATWVVRWATLAGGTVRYDVCVACLPQGDDESASVEMIDAAFVSGAGWLVRK